MTALLLTYAILNCIIGWHGTNSEVHQSIIRDNGLKRPLNETDFAGFSRNDLNFASHYLNNASSETKAEAVILEHNKKVFSGVSYDSTAWKPAKGNKLTTGAWKYENRYNYYYTQAEPVPFFKIIPGTARDRGKWYTVKVRVYQPVFATADWMKDIKAGETVVLNYPNGDEDYQYFAANGQHKTTTKIALKTRTGTTSLVLVKQVNGTWVLYHNDGTRVSSYRGTETLSVLKGSCTGTGKSFVSMLGNGSYREITETDLNNAFGDSGKVWNTVFFNENEYVVGIYQMEYEPNLRNIYRGIQVPKSETTTIPQ